MSDRPWIKWYAGDFLNGIVDMTPHEIAVYTVVLNRMYDEDGPIPDDPKRIARRCNMRLPQCEKAIQGLVDDGKLTRQDGMLVNGRAQKELEKRHEKSKKQASIARGRWQKEAEKDNKNNDGAVPTHESGSAKPMPTRNQKLEVDNSVPNGTDDPPIDHDELKAWAWRQGVAWIAKHDGVKPETVKTFLGAHCRDFGALEVAQAMAGMWHEDMATPGQFVNIRPMLTARLKNGVPTETRSDGSAERVARVVERLRARDQEGIPDGSGTDAPAVLPAVQSAGRG